MKTLVQVLSKKYGLMLMGDAARYLSDTLSMDTLTEEQLLETLDYIAMAYIKHQGSGKLFVDKESLKSIVDSLVRKNSVNQLHDADDEGSQNACAAALDDISALLHVVDAFSVPKWVYITEKKSFTRNTEANHVFATASAKAAVCRDRFDLIRQRILRNDMFRPSPLAGVGKSEHLSIISIKALKGQPAGQYLIFGMLTQMQEGKYHLEDPGGYVELQFPPGKKAAITAGFFTCGCFVLVEGYYTQTKDFHVVMMGMPPSEPRHKTLAAIGSNLNFFGNPPETDDADVLEEIEKSASDVSFAIMSDVWLDDPKVLAKLRMVFQGFSEMSPPPSLFIMIGNFTSKPFVYSSTGFDELKSHFNTLNDLITQFPQIAKSQFVFVPGPTDPWAGNTVPRPPIPKSFTGKLQTIFKNAIFTTNPSRIKYCTQEIVIYREDLLNKMRRNCILPADEEQEPDVKQHLVKTIIDQVHLTPLPFNVKPVLWDHDHALRIYPLPHLLILADKYDNYSVDYEGCRTVNPGSFGNQSTFVTYQPSDGSVDLCSV
ncbi:DNA polymerase epsilon subunit 2 [Chytridiales sp. JEL 0842]|nr:DNA polymerase epsilon subunit 2 [Chytridiales sp. JEL 0842]